MNYYSMIAIIWDFTLEKLLKFITVLIRMLLASNLIANR